MIDTTHKSNLTPTGRWLLELMQDVNHGYIERLTVRDGLPVRDPPPRVIRQVKFGGENGPRPEAAKKDFALKARVRDLFAHLEAVGDGVVQCIEVKHGLPFKMTVEEVTA